MKMSLQDLKIKVKAKADTFGKYSPADINCDELLWLIAQVEAAQQSVQSDGALCPDCDEYTVWGGVCHSATCPSCQPRR